MFDVLIIDDRSEWCEVVSETIGDINSYDTALTYVDAIKKIRERNYKTICLNLEMQSRFYGRKLLTLLKTKYPDVPVVLISGYFEGSLRKLLSRYPNVKEVLSKGKGTGQSLSPVLVDDLLDILPSLVDSVQDSPQIFSWLHLSDLHLGCTENTRDLEALKKALLEDLESHQQPVPQQSKNLAGVIFQPDAIFITGDIAYRALEIEYQQAESLLKSIWNITGLSKEQTFIVPGNHDVDRTVVRENPAYESMYNELSDNKIDESEWLDRLYRWWKWSDFHDLLQEKFLRFLEFTNKCTDIKTDAGYYVSSLSILGYTIEIVGLNSALISYQDNEDRMRNLWIGEPQLKYIEDNISEDADLRIALIHHPREAIHDLDTAWDRISELCSFILHGHLHKPKAVLTEDPRHSYVCLPGGSVYQGNRWRSQGYSYGQLNFNTRQLDLYLRMTTPSRRPIYTRDNQTYPIEGGDGHISLSLKRDM